jgi:hypothetical protein
LFTGACCFGDQDAGEWQTGRMILDKLHVLQRRTCAIRKSHSIAIANIRVGGKRKNSAATPGTENHGLCLDCLDPSSHQLERDRALHLAVVNQQPRRKPFVIAGHGFEFERSLEERVQHVETSFVGSKPGSLLLHAAEGSHCNVTIRLSTPRTTPALQLQ